MAAQVLSAQMTNLFLEKHWLVARFSDTIIALQRDSMALQIARFYLIGVPHPHSGGSTEGPGGYTPRTFLGPFFGPIFLERSKILNFEYTVY